MAERKRRAAWGITGGGDKLAETLAVMKEIKRKYEGEVSIEVYLSKAGEIVVKSYKLTEELKASFAKSWVEINANSPFLAGMLQTGRFEFLLIAPATSNTVAKLAVGIADTMLTNAAAMGLKAFVPVYVMPTDYNEGVVETLLPDGGLMKLRVRREDAQNVERLAKMEDVYLLEKPKDIFNVFGKHFGSKQE